MQTQHVPVLLDEVLQFLQPQPDGLYIDGTVGGGGHTAAILERCVPHGKVLGIDTDEQALQRVNQRLAEEVKQGRLLLVQANFAEMASVASKVGFGPVQGVLLDLGFSSDQMDDPQRGFSFSADGPLDMRLNPALPTTAADLVNTASEEELANIFWRYGEENRSRAIARRIVRIRATEPIMRTVQLAGIVAAGVQYKPGSIHPATRVFQALRIAVNAELEQLEAVLPQIVDILAVSMQTMSGQNGRSNAGRMVIISFHSLEDRIVKEFMRREATDCLCPPRTPVCVCGHKARLRILTPKPVTPTAQEIGRNVRSRSAKLRAAEIINPS
jgi:16S rRNA (cytosine1402-N4)-methyltransferase